MSRDDVNDHTCIHFVCHCQRQVKSSALHCRIQYLMQCAQLYTAHFGKYSGCSLHAYCFLLKIVASMRFETELCCVDSDVEVFWFISGCKVKQFLPSAPRNRAGSHTPEEAIDRSDGWGCWPLTAAWRINSRELVLHLPLRRAARVAWSDSHGFLSLEVRWGLQVF